MFLGAHDTVRSVAPDGHARFDTGVPGAGSVYLMIHDGHLYAGGPMGILRYSRRTWFDPLVDHPPSSVWNGGKRGFAELPTIYSGQFLVGYKEARVTGAVKTLNLSDGNTVWTALPVTVDGSVNHQWASSPVVVDGTAVVAVNRWLADGRETVLLPTDRADAPDAPTDGAPTGSVWALAPDGTERWRSPLRRAFGRSPRSTAPSSRCSLTAGSWHSDSAPLG